MSNAEIAKALRQILARAGELNLTLDEQVALDAAICHHQSQEIADNLSD